MPSLAISQLHLGHLVAVFFNRACLPRLTYFNSSFGKRKSTYFGTTKKIRPKPKTDKGLKLSCVLLSKDWEPHPALDGATHPKSFG